MVLLFWQPASARQTPNTAKYFRAMVVIGGVMSDEALEMVAVADRYDRVLISPSASSPKLTGT